MERLLAARSLAVRAQLGRWFSGDKANVAVRLLSGASGTAVAR
jgi:hypothetical protein